MGRGRGVALSGAERLLRRLFSRFAREDAHVELVVVKGRKYLLRSRVQFPSPTFVGQSQNFRGACRGRGVNATPTSMRRVGPGRARGQAGALMDVNLLATSQTFPLRHFCNLPPVSYVMCKFSGCRRVGRRAKCTLSARGSLLFRLR